MTAFAVSYQLNKKKNYPELWDAFTALGAFKAMNDFYLVDTQDTAQGLCGYLTSFIDEDDFLFVAPMTQKPAKHRCFQGTQAWIDARFR